MNQNKQNINNTCHNSIYPIVITGAVNVDILLFIWIMDTVFLWPNATML
jgi:hypothetical protein